MQLRVRAEKYLREVWPAVTRSLKEAGLNCELNLVGPDFLPPLRLVLLPVGSGLQPLGQSQG